MHVFKVAVVHTGLHVTFQAKIRLMTRKSKIYPCSSLCAPIWRVISVKIMFVLMF